MRNLLMQSWGIVVVLTAVACGSNDDSGTTESTEGAAASGASTGTAGKTANSGGSASNTRAGTGSAGTNSIATAPRAGTSGSTQPTAAGMSGSAGNGAAMADEDAGVPAAAGSGGNAAHAGSAGNAAHAGSGGAGSGGSTATAGSGGSNASAATFTQVYALLNKGCAGMACHVNATLGAAAMLSMTDKATAYKNLVNTDAVQCRGEKRVVPKDPTKSELVAALKHTQVGSCTRTPPMPENMPQWKDSDIALVTSWIEAGAQDN